MLTEDDYPVLSNKTLFKLTGYKQVSRQLASLKADGFYRARINRLGKLVLEAAHYEAVCSGQVKPTGRGGRHDVEPKLTSELT
jgi:hypothetical protein